MKKVFIFNFVLLITCGFSFGMNLTKRKILCSVDVLIQEGTTINICQGSFTTINASSGFVTYSWTGPQTGTSPSLAPTISGQYIVNAVDGFGCTSSDTIQVTIVSNPVPVIISSEGNQLCPGSSGTILSTTLGYSNYLWDNNSTSALRFITVGGTYTIQVTDGNGCIGTGSITITQPTFLLSTSSSTACSGETVTLTASGGTSYLWSTGETGSTIVTQPNIETEYSVIITKASCSDTLSQIISVLEMPNSIVEDTFYIASGDVVFINGPEGYENYLWTPIDNLSQVNTQGVNFTGDTSAVYNVHSFSQNGCERNDQVHIIVVELTIPTGFSPNGDFINDQFVIPEMSQYIADLTVFNRWGDIVYNKKPYLNDWNGTCQSSFCFGNSYLQDGTYFYEIEIEGVHFDGFTTIKR